MRNTLQSVSLDASDHQLESEHEVDSAIDTVVTFAFGSGEPLDDYLARVRATVGPRPTVKDLVDAVFRVREESGPIHDEQQRRDHAGMAMAAFLSADPADLGLPAAMFRVGDEVWLTPARSPRS